MGEHATGSPLKVLGSESESGWGFEIPGPCIQLASITSRRLCQANLARHLKGAVAQLGERLICTQEVAGSIPTSSTSVGTANTWARSSDG
jgi:hypothetical protein